MTAAGCRDRVAVRRVGRNFAVVMPILERPWAPNRLSVSSAVGVSTLVARRGSPAGDTGPARRPQARYVGPGVNA